MIFSPRSMKPIYNIEIIIKAFYLLKNKNNNVRLMLINDFQETEYSKKLIKLIRTLGLEKECIILSKLDYREMIETYSKADLIISIPTTDGTPNTVLEAMFMRKPVITGPYKLDENIFGNVFSIARLSDLELVKAIEKVMALNDNYLSEILENNRNKVISYANLNKSIAEINELYLSNLWN